MPDVEEAWAALWKTACAETDTLMDSNWMDGVEAIMAKARAYGLKCFEKGVDAVETRWYRPDRYDNDVEVARARIQALAEGRKEKDYVALD